MLCSLGAKANNKPSLAVNADATEMQSANSIEYWMNSNRYWGESKSRNHKWKTLSIESWMSSTSYWVNGNITGNQAMEQSCKLLKICASANNCNL